MNKKELSSIGNEDNIKINYNIELKDGHTSTIEDLVFNRKNSNILVSVGDD